MINTRFMKNYLLISLGLLSAFCLHAQSNHEVSMEIGQIDSITIGESYDQGTHWMKGFAKEYDQGTIYLDDWKNDRPVLHWNCHADIVDNPNENLITDAGRQHRAQIPAGYRIFVADGIDIPVRLRCLRYLFSDADGLISLQADVDTAIDKVLSHYYGQPELATIKYDTVLLYNNERYKAVLATKKYSWQKDAIKVQVVIKDELTKDNLKHTKGSLQMTNSIAYSEYLKKVAEKKKALDKEYAKVEKR
jgi:hypothetical protein